MITSKQIVGQSARLLVFAGGLNGPGGAPTTGYLGRTCPVAITSYDAAPVPLAVSAGVLQNLRLDVLTNTSPVDMTLTLRVNGAPTPITTAIPAGATFSGLLPGSVTVANMDLVDLQLVTLAGGAIGTGVVLTATVELVPT